jgi:hypothetical protein
MIDDECGAVGGMRIGRGNQYSEKTCPSVSLSTTNPTRPDLGSNSGRCGGKPATNRLSYGTAIASIFSDKIPLDFTLVKLLIYIPD